MKNAIIELEKEIRKLVPKLFELTGLIFVLIFMIKCIIEEVTK